MAKKNNKSAAKQNRKFDLNDPVLPDWIEQQAHASGGYPYREKLDKKQYEADLLQLQIQLVRLQTHIRKTGQRLVCVFEGRDSAGKGGCIKRIMAHLNPRHAKAVALAKPTETERGQWYFQRYVPHLPTAGDITLLDRSWYNRAGVERVMGYCTEDELARFLREVTDFESMLVRDGVILRKFWLTIGRETQLKRFHARRHEPLKQWKLSPTDLASLEKWDEYTAAKEDMFRFSHTPETPWTVVRANDKRRARIELIRALLENLDYEGRDDAVIGAPDPLIVGVGDGFFADA